MAPIVKANELDFSMKKIKMIIAGYAGIGKTTLALSAPKPLLFDFDKGIDRVEAPFRSDTYIVSDFATLLQDIHELDLSSYETIVIDTGGKLLELVKPYVIKQNAQNGQRDGSLSIKGWGAIATEFKRFTNTIEQLGKHLIFVFHTREEYDGDQMKLRIAIEGSSKNKIWEEMDLGGFIEMQGQKRTIGFSNTERYYAKGTHGIKGIYKIPGLEHSSKNTFLTDLFNKVITDLQGSAKKFEDGKKAYNTAMKVRVIIESASTLEQLNSVLTTVKTMAHSLTSEKELKTHLLSKAKELGFKYDRETEQFV